MDNDPEDWGSIPERYFEPKQAKGGVFAPADIKLIKRALLVFVHNTTDPLSTADERAVVNLLHRLNRIKD